MAAQQPKITSGGRILNFTGQDFIFTTDSGSTTHSTILATLDDLRTSMNFECVTQFNVLLRRGGILSAVF